MHWVRYRAHYALCRALWCPVVLALRSIARALRATLKSVATECSLLRHRANTPLSRQRGLYRDPSCSIPTPTLSRHSISYRDMGPSILNHDSEIPVATQTSQPAAEPCHNITILVATQLPTATEGPCRDAMDQVAK